MPRSSATGERSEPLVESPRSARRFRDPDWAENQIFDFIRQPYLLTSQWLLQTVREVDFYTRQFIDAVAPTNFILTNPAVLRTTVETNGQNLVRGYENLLNDLERAPCQSERYWLQSSAWASNMRVWSAHVPDQSRRN